MKLKKNLAILLAITICLSIFPVNTFAEGTSTPNDNTVPVKLTATAADFKVTLPTALPIDVAADGTVTTATNANIVNSSKGPVKLVSTKVEPINSWELASYNSNFQSYKADSKKIGLNLFNTNVPVGTSVAVAGGSNVKITANDSLNIPYNAKVATQTTAINENPMNVIFTFGWYTDGSNNTVENESAMLSLNKDNLDMYPGSQEVIYAVTQDNNSAQALSTIMLMAEDTSAITWSSSNDAVATVSDGVVTANDTGRAYITAEYNGLTANCNVAVNEPFVPLEAIAFSKDSTAIVNGLNETVLLFYNPEKFSGSTDVTISSSDEGVVTVTPTSIAGVTGDDGASAIVLRAVGNGRATLTVSATTTDGVVTDSMTIDVITPLTSLIIEGGTEVKVGETLQLSAVKNPSNTTDDSAIVWSSSDESVATVNSNGLVTGVSEGTVAIVAECNGLKVSLNTSIKSSIPSLNANSYLNKDKMKAALQSLTGSIVFSTESPEGKTGTDISEAGDGSVIAVITGQDAVVYANGGCLSPVDSSYLFSNYKASSMDLGGLDTSTTTNMSVMFGHCYFLRILDLSNFNTSNVISMGLMFASSFRLTSLDLSSFNISNVMHISGMFYSCSGLTTLNLSNFETSKITNLSTMFYGCSSLTSLDLSNFDTSNVTNTTTVFTGCTNLTTVYAKTQADADKLNGSSEKPVNVNVIVKI